MVALKVAAVRSRAARPAAGDPGAGAAAFPADPRVVAAPAAAVAQFRAARPAPADPVAEAAAFLGVRPAAAAPAAAEVVCPAWGASRFLDPRGINPRRTSAKSRYASNARVPRLTRARVAVCDQRC